MPTIDKFTVSLVTYQPLRPFPGSQESHLAGVARSLQGLTGASEILVYERTDAAHRTCLMEAPFVDERWRIIPAENDPPYADPLRQRQLDEASNDWVLILDDDERVSWGMVQLLNRIGREDLFPGREWMGIAFPREDYILHRGDWRYIPANGLDHQLRLVHRRQVRWGGGPHTWPEVDGMFLRLNAPPILHYRDYEKILSWSAYCNEMFAHLPQTVAMNEAYVERVKGMIGVMHG